MKLKTLLVMVITLVLLAAVVASWLWHPKDISVLGLDPQHLVLDARADCQAAPGPCVFKADKLRLSLSLPGPLRPLEPFEMHLQVEGLVVEQAVATFTMQGMEMGLNRYVLRPSSQGWRGKALLPVCSEQRKDWRVAINLRASDGDYRVVFPFRTQ